MILSCGDSLFDVFVEPGSSVASVGMEARIGGSPLNVAIAARRLGQESGFLNRISTDSFGQRLMRHFAAEGVDTSLIVRTARPTTLAIVGLDDKGVAAYSFYVEADRSLELKDLPAALPDAVRCIHLGSYATALEPTASTLEALIAREHGRRFISYDPNVRPSVLSDPEVWRARVAALVRRADLVKASLEDIHYLYPGRGVESVLADWIARGASLAVATMGSEGAVARTKGDVEARVEAPAIDVVDTVGAGDSFQAALLTWLAENDRLSAVGAGALSATELGRLLGFATRVAAITCSRRGADMPHRHEID